MIPELNLPIKVAGHDGFYWWIGQVQNFTDLKPGTIGNRFKVRIVGHHVKSCEGLKTEDLPWALVMMPVTHPTSADNNISNTVEINAGDWVIGFFMDGNKGQQPIIMGQLPKSTKSSVRNKVSQVTGECIPFSKIWYPVNPLQSVSGDNGEAVVPQPRGNGSGNVAPANTAPAVERTLVNPSGIPTCIQVADVQCKNANGQLQSRFERLLTDLFANIQQSGGSLGSNIISPYTGVIVDYAAAAQGYIDRGIGIVKSLLGGVKATLRKYLKIGITQILQVLGFASRVDEQGKKTKIGMFASATKWLNTQLGLVNCVIDELEKKIIDFITNIILDALMSVINAATCAVQSIVNNILDQILSFLTAIIDLILGPLQAILSLIASPLDILGKVIGFVFQLLGIKCDGGKGACKPNTEYCSKPPKKKPGTDDFAYLDKLIANIQSDMGFEALSTSCEEKYSIPCPADTVASVSGGIPDTTKFTDEEPIFYDIPDFPSDFYDSFISGIFTGPVSNTTSEAGITATFDVRLKTKPSKNVDISISSSDSTEGKAGPTKITFTPTNWYVDKTITVTPIDDVIDDGDVTYSIELRAVSSDANYNGQFAFVEILNVDNEPPGSGPPFSVSEDSVSTIKINGFTTTSAKLIQNINIGISSNVIIKLVENELSDGSERYSFDPIVPVIVDPTIGYQLTSDKTVVKEGESITFTLRPIGGTVPDGTVFNYVLFGVIQPSDFTNNTTIGSMTMKNNIAVKTIVISNDTSIAEAEEVSFNVSSVSTLFTIINSNPTPDPVVPLTQPVFKPPILGIPEVDDRGRIIDIPIIDAGDPYLYPPNIIIFGEGKNAFASVDLDKNGYLSKIKVKRSGIGYLPFRLNKNCIIDGFNLIRPGMNYSDDVQVLVDGIADVVKPIVKNGMIVELSIIDKTKVFNSQPNIEIIGSGMGAIVRPTFKCYSDAAYSGYINVVAPSQNAQVVDCP